MVGGYRAIALTLRCVFRASRPLELGGPADLACAPWCSDGRLFALGWKRSAGIFSAIHAGFNPSHRLPDIDEDQDGANDNGQCQERDGRKDERPKKIPCELGRNDCTSGVHDRHCDAVTHDRCNCEREPQRDLQQPHIGRDNHSSQHVLPPAMPTRQIRRWPQIASSWPPRSVLPHTRAPPRFRGRGPCTRLTGGPAEIAHQLHTAGR